MVCPLSSEVISHILWLIQRKPYAVYSRSLCFRVKGTLILKTKTNKNPKLKQNKRKRNYTNQNPQAKKVIKFNDGAFSTKTPQILHNNHKSCITTPPPQQLSVFIVWRTQRHHTSWLFVSLSATIDQMKKCFVSSF